MNNSIQLVFDAPAVLEISNFDYVSMETGEAINNAEASIQVVRESLSERFHDEIDAWARRALAANGFGDCP